jgi:hypothetical protein
MIKDESIVTWMKYRVADGLILKQQLFHVVSFNCGVFIDTNGSIVNTESIFLIYTIYHFLKKVV